MKIIGIVGASFCGSTLFGRVLSSLPGVIYPGELHWLLDPHRVPLCYKCGHGCPIYGRSAERRITPQNIYEQVAEAEGGCDVLVSGDKSLDHYQRYKRRADYYILLTRDVMSHVASLARTEKSFTAAATAWSLWHLRTIPQLENQKTPVLCVSIERFLQNPQACADWLHQFTGGIIPKGTASLPEQGHNCAGSASGVSAGAIDPNRPRQRTVPPENIAEVKAITQDAAARIREMRFPAIQTL